MTEKLDRSIGRLVRDFLIMHDFDNPFRESKSYNVFDSNCKRRHQVLVMHQFLGSLYQMLDENVVYREVADNIGKYFVVGYELSAVYDQLYTDREWSEQPFRGGWLTLDAVWKGKEAAAPQLYRPEVLHDDPLVTKAYVFYKDACAVLASIHVTGGNNEEECRQLLQGLHTVLKNSLQGIAARIEERL